MADWLDVSDVSPAVNYTVGGSPQTVFAVPFVFFANGDLQVFVNDVLKAITADYTVSGALSATGGTITFLSALTNSTVTIARHIPVALSTHIAPSGPLDVPGLNLQFSKIVAMIQETQNHFTSLAVLTSTSPTSLTIGTGIKVFTTQAGKSYIPGMVLTASSIANPANFMTGTVTAYNDATGALTLSVTTTGGSGTLADWLLSVSTIAAPLASLFTAQAATLNTDALYDNTTVGGYFADYDCRGAMKIVLVQSENQAGVAGGGMRDAVFIQHQDNDVSDYTAIGQKVSNGLRCYTTGKAGGGGNYTAQFKDLVGADFAAIGSIAWSLRGCAAIACTAIGYNVGIIDNEFSVQQPASAAAQSFSMAGGQFIVSSKFAASDLTHLARGVFVTNLGKSIHAALSAQSAGTGGDNGQYEYLIRGDLATVNVGAFIMPASAAGNVGTRIVYDTGDFSEYDRALNTYTWAIGGTAAFNVNAVNLYSTVITAQLGNGSAAAPSYSFFNSQNAGMYRAASNEVGFSTNSIEAMRIDASQRLIIGHTTAISTQFASFALTPQSQMIGNSGSTSATLSARFTADPSGVLISFAKSRNATKGSHTVLVDGDTIGSFTFAGSDGTNFIESARISATVTGTLGTNIMPGALRFWTTPPGSNVPTERENIDSNGFHSITTGSLGRSSPVTKTADFTVAVSENWLINNKSGSTCTVTLPAPASFPGREIMIKTIQAQTVVSATANVIPLAGGAAATAILAATTGKYAVLVSNGTNWEITQGN